MSVDFLWLAAEIESTSVDALAKLRRSAADLAVHPPGTRATMIAWRDEGIDVLRPTGHQTAASEHFARTFHEPWTRSPSGWPVGSISEHLFRTGYVSLPGGVLLSTPDGAGTHPRARVLMSSRAPVLAAYAYSLGPVRVQALGDTPWAVLWSPQDIVLQGEALAATLSPRGTERRAALDRMRQWLSEYTDDLTDPEEVMDFLPNAIERAKANKLGLFAACVGLG